MERRKWIVVCLSGVTCGGKTSLTKALHNKYPGSVVLSQDDYFLPEDSDKHTLIPELNHFNWDILTAFDMNKMRKDIADILNLNCDKMFPVLIIEGVLVLNDEEISTLCDLKYFLTLPYEVCLERRSKRTYTPPDVPGYFQKCVWPEYIKSKEVALRMNPDVHVIEGVGKIDDILQRISNDIDSLLKQTVSVSS